MLVAQDSNVECAVSTSLRSALANKKEMSDRKRCSTTGPNKFVMRKLEVRCPFGVRNDSGSLCTMKSPGQTGVSSADPSFPG